MNWVHIVNKKKRVYQSFAEFDANRNHRNGFYSSRGVLFSQTMLKTFGISLRNPDLLLMNNISSRHVLHFILTGKGRCNGYPIEAGDVVYCARLHPYSISSNRADPCTYAWITFEGGKADKYLTMMGLKSPFQVYKTEHIDRVCSIFQDMLEKDHSGEGEELYLEGCMIQLLAQAIPPTHSVDQSESTKMDTRVNNAIQYISQNFRKPNLKVSDVAAATDTNEKHLQRIFKAKMGISIYKYISKLRLETSLMLLSSSNYNINEISEYLGYNDCRTFCDAFKKHFGASPTKYIPDEL